MSFFRSLLHALNPWRRRREGPKTSRHAGVAVEHLDHRQLLAASFTPILPFTGNVTTDFPTALIGDGVARFELDRTAPNNDTAVVYTEPLNSVIGETIGPDGLPVSNSGFAIGEFRVAYDRENDILNIGLIAANPDAIVSDFDGPQSSNSGAVSAAVAALNPPGFFTDLYDAQAGETIFAFFDLDQDNKYDIQAGFPLFENQLATDPAKTYVVALAVPNTAPAAPDPRFGAPFTAPLADRFQGNLYLVNDPNHPDFEFSITNFSEVFATFNPGEELNPDSVFSVGIFANNPFATGNGTQINLRDVVVGDATLPDICPDTPPVIINPHENSHVNTAHPSDVRVVVFGTATFDVDTIIPETVTVGGALPFAAMPPRDINGDSFPDQVFLFNGSEITLPPGFSNAVVEGDLTTGGMFSSAARVFNRDASYYSAHDLALQEARQERLGEFALLTPLQRRWLTNTEGVDDLAANRAQALTDAQAAASARAATKAQARANNPTAVRAPAGVSVTNGPTVKVPMRRNAKGPAVLNVDSSPTVAVRTRAGTGKLQPSKLKIDMSAAQTAMSH